MTLERLAEMTMNGFRRLEEALRTDLDFKIKKLDEKLDRRFDELSLRMDGLALDKASWKDHIELSK
ncbi:MAG TPA: hypothetical protein VFQ72_03495 [Candidatus Paceibacterota bacterium]|nr:hypothetical protein [Candidatus Paceibacterota bacterium]